jgi:Fic family protein
LHRTAIQSDEEQLARRYADAIQHLSQFVASAVEARQPAELTVELLSSLHRTAVGESAADSGGFRRNAINPLYPDHTPCLPEELPLMLHLTLEWFSAESINEMMPVEQATLVHVRLNDLQPFPKTENRVIRLATSLYTLRAGLPPLIITEDLINEYYQSLLAGLQMATQPLIELFARCLCATLDNMKRLAENS